MNSRSHNNRDVSGDSPDVASVIVYAPLSAMTDTSRRGSHPISDETYALRDKGPCLEYLLRHTRPKSLDYDLDTFMIERMGTYIDPQNLVHYLNKSGHSLSLYDLVEHLRSRFPFGQHDGVHYPYVILVPMRPHELSFSVRTPYVLLPSRDAALLNKVAHDVSWAKPFMPECPANDAVAELTSRAKKHVDRVSKSNRSRDPAAVSNTSSSDVFAEWAGQYENPDILRFLFNHAGSTLSASTIAEHLNANNGHNYSADDVSACLDRMFERQVCARSSFGTYGVVRGDDKALTLETTDQPFFLRTVGHGLYTLMILPRNMPNSVPVGGGPKASLDPATPSL